MPKLTNDSRTRHYHNMDMFVVDDTKSLAEQEDDMRHKLKKFVLNEFQQDVLVLRFVYEMTFEEIANELYCPSVNTVFGAYKRALALLKERGFK